MSQVIITCEHAKNVVPELVKKQFQGKEEFPPDFRDKIKVAREHLRRVVELKGEVKGMNQMRKHLAWYIRGIRDAARVRTEINKLTDVEEIDQLLASLGDKTTN